MARFQFTVDVQPEQLSTPNTQPATQPGAQVVDGQTANLDTFQFDKAVDDQLIVAEYNTLRDEILKRIEHGHRITSATLLAAGALFAFCLKDLQGQHSVEAALFLLYPLFAFFMAIEWSFSNMRIIQLADYLHWHVEKQHRPEECRNGAQCHGWENYLANSQTALMRWHITGEWAPAFGIFVGTQFVALSCGLLFWFFKLLPSSNSDLSRLTDRGMIFMMIIDAAVMIVTGVIICRSKLPPVDTPARRVTLRRE